MKLTCKCGYIASSLIVVQEKALEEILANFAKHIVTKHQQFHDELVKSIAKITADSAAIAMVAKYSTLLDLPLEDVLPGGQSNYIMEKFSELTDSLQECLGIEVLDTKLMGEDEEEEEDSEGEEEDIEEIDNAADTATVSPSPLPAQPAD